MTRACAGAQADRCATAGRTSLPLAVQDSARHSFDQLPPLRVSGHCPAVPPLLVPTAVRPLHHGSRPAVQPCTAARQPAWPAAQAGAQAEMPSHERTDSASELVRTGHERTDSASELARSADPSLPAVQVAVPSSGVSNPFQARSGTHCTCRGFRRAMRCAGTGCVPSSSGAVLRSCPPDPRSHAGASDPVVATLAGCACGSQ